MTVSAVPDDRSPEVGGLQNTGTNLGASIGTALAGSLLIAALTVSFLSGNEQNPDVPDDVAQQANVQFAGGAPFISDADLEAAPRRRRGERRDRPGHAGRAFRRSRLAGPGEQPLHEIVGEGRTYEQAGRLDPLVQDHLGLREEGLRTHARSPRARM